MHYVQFMYNNLQFMFHCPVHIIAHVVMYLLLLVLACVTIVKYGKRVKCCWYKSGIV